MRCSPRNFSQMDVDRTARCGMWEWCATACTGTKEDVCIHKYLHKYLHIHWKIVRKLLTVVALQRAFHCQELGMKGDFIPTG